MLEILQFWGEVLAFTMLTMVVVPFTASLLLWIHSEEEI